jgi:putative FmdB family regulatory protein
MPIYEYECQACGHTLETMQKMSDAPLTDCPACHQAKLEKLISATGFRLKGGGWYETDIKKSNQKNVCSTDSTSTEKTGCGSCGKNSPHTH